ncbi:MULTISPECIES: DNA polymerase IV [unclassified Actinomyces]|uniref:DNA polymerase IV n=1 Tax=unclassified Actinomyces TaxID=2609248 RepID=UPI002016AC35|nr:MULTISPECIES: DNA polymerase IV [unclassified Actinomyces]MCL3778259.1 DNA polymerase IV [Actinomyces sp. AC-20-1]MCL3790437.1 DNA polymerase IV [Actinomyces sp. 187325]MCL3792714.1 DNA polymerase IV [Actinomyces sp. 186855]MCL3795194.1 DNA polymerase IV [Actinomyces sp. 217892]
MSRAPRNEAARRSWGDDDSATPILHVDMDAFFASVELLERPELRGRPVIVGGADGRGVVSAATYEARAHGVTSAMSMAEALRRCPHAVVLPVRHGVYSRVSAQVMEVLGEVTPLLERVSVDEAFLDVSGSRRRMGSPVRIGHWVRTELRRRLGLPASVGIASTKFVAKLASAHAKPDGLLLVPAGATQDFLDVLPVGAMWGVGDKSARVLARWGITDVRTLAATDVRRLERILGTAAAHHLHDLSHGIDPRPVTVSREEKSVGTESTFFDTITDREDARRVLLDQCHQCAARLRQAGTRGRTVVLKARGADFVTVTRSRTLSEPTDLARDVFAVVEALFDALPDPAGGFRLLGVRVEGLSRADDGVQLLLDEDQRRGAPERAADAVRARWGRTAVAPASLLRPPQPPEV